MLSSRQSLKWAVTAIAAMMLTSAVAQAAIIHVPGDFPTIQEAIDFAVDGDEVEVHPDIYNETINFLGKAITVRSSDGPEVTIIDGTGHFHVVQCVNGEGPDTASQRIQSSQPFRRRPDRGQASGDPRASRLGSPSPRRPILLSKL